MFNVPIPGSPQPTGSFMAPAGGGGSNVMQAMNTPGMPVTAQQGAAAPVSMPQAPNPSQPPVPFINPEQGRQQEVQGILKALQERLAAHTEIDKAKAGVHKFQAPLT